MFLACPCKISLFFKAYVTSYCERLGVSIEIIRMKGKICLWHDENVNKVFHNSLLFISFSFTLIFITCIETLKKKITKSFSIHSEDHLLWDSSTCCKLSNVVVIVINKTVVYVHLNASGATILIPYIGH